MEGPEPRGQPVAEFILNMNHVQELRMNVNNILGLGSFDFNLKSFSQITLKDLFGRYPHRYSIYSYYMFLNIQN